MAKEYLRGASGSEDVKVSTNSGQLPCAWHGMFPRTHLTNCAQDCEVQIGEQAMRIVLQLLA